MVSEKNINSRENKEGTMEKIRRFGRMIGGATLAMELIKLLSADPAAADEEGLKKIAALRNAATEVQPAQAKEDLKNILEGLDITVDETRLEDAIGQIQKPKTEVIRETR